MSYSPKAFRALASYLVDACGTDYFHDDFTYGESIGPTPPISESRYLEAAKEFYKALTPDEKGEVVTDAMIGHEGDFLEFPYTYISEWMEQYLQDDIYGALMDQVQIDKFADDCDRAYEDYKDRMAS
jgi:hypothetical protein